jgi:hypothetical protein
MIFGVAAPAIDILVERAGVPFAQIGDDEARVGPFRANFDAGDDPLDATPAFGAVEKPPETMNLTPLVTASKLAFAPISSPSTCRGNVVVGATVDLHSFQGFIYEGE